MTPQKNKEPEEKRILEGEVDESLKKKPRVCTVAYYCMEYGLQQNLALYGGGLGILAGDIVKESFDEKLPLTGVGILWDKGYTSQTVDEDGKVTDTYVPTNREAVDKVDIDGVYVTIDKVKVPLNAYHVIGLESLYLLEPATEEHKTLYTEKLYQGDRIAQEIILGVGGVRLIRALDKKVNVHHFNEGHAVLAALELIREKMSDKKMTFEDAWTATKKECVFTTHTPVKAGNEHHDMDELIKKCSEFSFTKEQLTQIGGDPFGMTETGLRVSYLSNGVSQLHAETARKMWKDVTDKSEIIAITNGVHLPSWQDKDIKESLDDMDKTKKLWETHQKLKGDLIELIKERTTVTLAADKLLIGFARRSATYKRHTLFLQKIDEISDLLEKGEIQMVFSGKAHPDDKGGKEQITQLVAAMKKYPKGVVYLENYDMKLGSMLTRGSDVWLNNPVRPMEASGTSGMKAAMNGVLNCSILDGWWPEACEHGKTGWQIGKAHDDEEADAIDAKALIEVLKDEVYETYYNHHNKWVEMMMASIKSTQDAFSAKRMVEEYYEKMYEKQPDMAA